MTLEEKADEILLKLSRGELHKEQAVDALVKIGANPFEAWEAVSVTMGGSDVLFADSQEEIDRMLDSEGQR